MNRQLLLILFSLFFIFTTTAIAAEEDYNKCLLNLLNSTDSNTLIHEIIGKCDYLKSVESDNALIKRQKAEKEYGNNPFGLTPHKPNYILPFSYNSNINNEPFNSTEKSLKSLEIKFQISIKLQLLEDIFADDIDLYFAYTNQSYWQAYNKDISSPFRETNHEPEMWLSFNNKFEISGIDNNILRIGAVHQSNGRAGQLSRSWNRIYAELIFKVSDLYLSIKPWWRIPEEQKSYSTDPRGDDNPNMEKYMGYGELMAVYKWKDYTLSTVFRNNFRSNNNKGSIQLDIAFPLPHIERIKGYVQYFNGYGESLIDYNAPINRIGVGVIVSNWL